MEASSRARERPSLSDVCHVAPQRPLQSQPLGDLTGRVLRPHTLHLSLHRGPALHAAWSPILPSTALLPSVPASGAPWFLPQTPPLPLFSFLRPPPERAAFWFHQAVSGVVSSSGSQVVCSPAVWLRAAGNSVKPQSCPQQSEKAVTSVSHDTRWWKWISCGADTRVTVSSAWPWVPGSVSPVSSSFPGFLRRSTPCLQTAVLHECLLNSRNQASRTQPGLSFCCNMRRVCYLPPFGSPKEHERLETHAVEWAHCVTIALESGK